MKKPEEVIPKAPAVVLVNPKYGHNVAGVLRSCSCFSVPQLWWSGDRVSLDVGKGERLPREERMRGYRDVEMVRADEKFLSRFGGFTPVAVEFRPNSENLLDFEHPENAVYLFGPEDGHLGRVELSLCHRFLTIPTWHCLNLSGAVTTVLYDRLLKRTWGGQEPVRPVSDYFRSDRASPEHLDLFQGVSESGLGASRRG